MVAWVLQAVLVVGFVVKVDGKLVRKLSYDCCAGYEPLSNVVPHSRIDLDQAEMEDHLANNDFEAAKSIYMFGGNAGATAEIRVTVISGLPALVKKGAQVKQGNFASGILKNAQSGGEIIGVSYTSVCKEGGSATKEVSGCFINEGGAITIDDVDIGAPSSVQNTYLTLASLSTSAHSKMSGQEVFAIYRSYYGQSDYAHQRVMAALDQKGTCSACDHAAREQVAKKTSAYMNVWMRVIHEMEDAIVDCKNECPIRPQDVGCNEEPVHSWDVAAAFYVGSLEGFYGTPGTSGANPGKLLHELADMYCKNFGTCNKDGLSKVNQAIIGQFRMGQYKLFNGKCLEALPIKRRIVQLMSIPLIQGALQHAFTMRPGNQIGAGGSEEKAKGAAFAAAILPRIAACDGAAAMTIEENMGIRSHPYMSSGFVRVKEAFESTYDCLGITCKEVGGILGTTVQGETSYLVEPCVGTLPGPSLVVPTPSPAPPPTALPSSEDEGLPLWVTISIAISGTLLFLSFFCGLWFSQLTARKAKPYRKFEDRFECCFCGHSPDDCICGERPVEPSLVGKPSAPGVRAIQQSTPVRLDLSTPVVPVARNDMLVIDGGYSTDEEQPNTLAKL